MFKPTQELKQIISKQEQVVAKVASDLYNALIKASPVGDPSIWKVNEGRPLNNLIKPAGYVGGNLRGSWMIQKVRDTWIIDNPTEYALIRLSPYANNGQIGSKQMPAGIYPIIQKYEKRLQSELRKIK